MKKEHFAKQLSNYIDYYMRIGFKGKSPEVIDIFLDNFIGLFHCLNSKVKFQIESNKLLSERLLKDLTISIINERKFITKLKQEAGLSFVSKMQERLNDYEDNKKVGELYKSFEKKGSPKKIKFNIKVLCQYIWGINEKSYVKIIIPKFLSDYIVDFENFYLKKFSGKKLKWCLGLSRVEFQYLYLNKKYISTSTLPQLLILLLLEQKGELSLDIISQLLGCDSSIIINDIQGLIYNPSFNPKAEIEQGIILGNFSIETKEFRETDKITINKGFTNTKIRFSTIPLKHKKSDSEKKVEELEELKILKKYEENILHATITRIMKSRIGRETTHKWLVDETAKQIDLFKPEPQQIKENIEKLIEKNINKRSENASSCYEYIENNYLFVF